MNEVNKMTVYDFMLKYFDEPDSYTTLKDLKALIGNEMKMLLPKKHRTDGRCDCHRGDWNDCIEQINERINDYMEVK